MLSGAFVGLEDIIDERINKSTYKVGFDTIVNNKSNNISKEELLEYVQPDDLIHFGMIPEIVGRLPIITHTNYLDKKALQHILTEPQNAILKQYQKIFAYNNIKLTFTKNAIERIADYAEALETGARGIRTCVERVLKDPLFNAPDIGKDYSKDNMFNLKIDKLKVDKALKDFIKFDK